MLIIIFSTIFISIKNYRKNNIEFLNMKKITIMSSFLSFFLIQTFLLMPLMKLPIPFSFDSITTITVAFIFGPLEGILFGWVADSLRVLINGWSYQILPSLLYPMIAIISSCFGMLYFQKKNINKNKSILIFQLAVISLFLIMLSLEFVLITTSAFDEYNKNGIFYSTLTTCVISLIFMEIIFIYLQTTEKSNKDLFLFVLLVCVAYLDRIIELIIRPFTEYFTGFAKIYSIALLTRILSSTYLIPTVSITSFILIKTTIYVLELN